MSIGKEQKMREFENTGPGGSERERPEDEGMGR